MKVPGGTEAGEGPWGHTSSQPTLLGGCCRKTEAQGCLSSGLHTHAYMCGQAHTQHEKGFRYSQNILQPGQNSPISKGACLFDWLHVPNLAHRKK